MYQDEIIAEVWKNRDDYVKKHHYSLAEMVADLQARQEERGSKVVDHRTIGSTRPHTAPSN